MSKQAITLILTFSLGFAVGKCLNVEISTLRLWLEYLLYLLMFFIGISISDEIFKLRNVSKFLSELLRLTTSTLLGSVLGGVLAGAIAVLSGYPAELGFSDPALAMRYGVAVSIGMGWYTITGAVLSMRGAFLGFLGFTSNLSRELITYLLYPLLPKKLRVSGISMGGATTMDTTLPVIHKFGGPKASLLSFAHGLILTLLVPIILPVIV
jgi:uncharacterized membrane protein YbjE (DUF340 family)